MIRHIVLFRLAEGIPADDPRVLRATQADAVLAERIPEAASWRFGPNVTRGAVGADFAGVGDFASIAALDAFLAHPAHREAAELWHDIATWTVADLDLG